MIFWTPIFFFLNKQDRWKVVKLWGYSHLWLQHKICNNSYDFRGIEKIPASGSMLVAGKHQSAWDTYTLVLFFDDPAFVLKRGLMYIPLFGWYLQRMKSVPVDRGRGSVALASMTKNARQLMAQDDRQIIIYPEGTRKIPGAKPQYKYGITHLYLELGKPTVPFALNSGLFWSRHSFLRYPGTITLQFLEPIAPGLAKNTFSKLLQDTIEERCNALMREAAQNGNSSPLASQFL